MYQHFIKIFNFLAAGIALFLLLFAIKEFIENPNLLVHPDIFVNYEGGFIRRGFDGQLLYLISETSNINFLTIAKTYNIFTFIIFIFLIISLKIKRNIPAYILFSMSALLLYLCYVDRGLRKDHLLFILIILQSLLFSKDHYLKSFWGKLAFISVSIIGTLIHEVFFVITIFPAIIGFWIGSKTNKTNFTKKLLLAVPSAILFIILLTIFVGTENQVNQIINSYSNISYNLDYLKALFSKSFYFWDQNHHLKNILLFIGILLLHGLFIGISVYNHLQSALRKRYFLLLLSAQILVLFFLSMIAIDYGRWVFFCFFTVIIYTYNYSIPISEEFNLIFLDFLFNKIKHIPFILFFLLTMPHSHWNGIDSMLKNNLLIQLKDKLYEP